MIPNDDDFEAPQQVGLGSIPFDARQYRSKTLSNLQIKAINAYDANDYYSWFKALHSIYYICFSYVKPEEAAKVKEKIKEIKGWMNSKGNGNIIIDQLDELTEMTMWTFRNQFMQVQEAESGEFKPDDILGED